MLVFHGSTPTWWLHAGLCKLVQNILTNIWILGKHSNLKLGEVYSLSISYNITTSWLNPLNGFRIIFSLRLDCVTLQAKNTVIHAVVGISAMISHVFLPHFIVFCDQLLNRNMAAWSQIVLYNKETKKSVSDVISSSVLQWIISKNQSKCDNNLTYYKL